ncbi:nucleotide exchange factor GrpE [Dehalobacterium formicoaceticum]|uniref:Protein GrpE n=1 Tax=Dehalobacterium formicoaceticum TaxID=51515 RepID=A0ABT1Y4V2_9FIRM|nr:nucleotide exchange factor GrpE [Dehalobacterium formicoaceticum]MCR6544944.1 nucleotide exchange factor GrpE [Dehalobacterium formicoaceticum]
MHDAKEKDVITEDQILDDADLAQNDQEKTSSESVNQEEELRNLVQKLEEEKGELVNLTQRLQADFENFRRRTRGEKEELIRYAAEGVITQLLPVLDNFERAIMAAKDGEEGKGYLDGVEMIYRQLLQVLTNEGLEVVDAVGCAFDPNCHEAVMQIDGGEAPKDTVLEELQKGYFLKGKLIRPSMVKVAK